MGHRGSPWVTVGHRSCLIGLCSHRGVPPCKATMGHVGHVGHSIFYIQGGFCGLRTSAKKKKKKNRLGREKVKQTGERERVKNAVTHVTHVTHHLFTGRIPLIEVRSGHHGSPWVTWVTSEHARASPGGQRESTHAEADRTRSVRRASPSHSTTTPARASPGGHRGSPWATSASSLGKGV